MQPDELPADGAGSRGLGIAALIVALLPPLAAVWLVPGFGTQDGPAHLYNARILLDSLGGGDSPFGDTYRVRPDPLPNWAGHLATMAALSALPTDVADKAMISLTLVGFAGALAWLRWRVAGWAGMPTAAFFAAILGMNVVWLWGFSGFLLGACLFPITLGLWWDGRDRFGPGRALALAGLMVVGYACHLVSLGLTVAGVIGLAVVTPGAHRKARDGWTALGLTPVLPLAVIYKGLTRQAGPLRPDWQHLSRWRTPSAWLDQLGWVDPISLASKATAPFAGAPSKWYGLVTPALWTAIGLALLIGSTWAWRDRDESLARRGWLAVAVVLILGGLLGPDSLGTSHGHYLPQRILLLGLAALVPWLALDSRGLARRLGTAALVVAWAIQSATVWDYARHSRQVVGEVRAVRSELAPRDRIATLLIDPTTKFRANPLLHADNWLGLEGGRVIWNNYEAAHYYFPVQFRPGIERPSPLELEEISLMRDDHEARATRWERLLREHGQSIDALVVWGREPRLDAINARWFGPGRRMVGGRVRIYRRAGVTSSSSSARRGTPSPPRP